MKYAMLIYEQPGSLGSLGKTERGEVLGEYLALATDPRWSQGTQLQPAQMATTVQVREGEPRRTAGPSANTGEALGGVMVFEVADLDEALELAALIPVTRLGGQSRYARWSNIQADPTSDASRGTSCTDWA